MKKSIFQHLLADEEFIDLDEFEENGIFYLRRKEKRKEKVKAGNKIYEA